MDKIVKDTMYELVDLLPNQLFISEHGNLLDMRDNFVLSKSGDTNWTNWHKKTLSHEYFGFNGEIQVFISNEVQAQEFKAIVVNYYTNQRGYAVVAQLDSLSDETILSHHDTYKEAERHLGGVIQTINNSTFVKSFSNKFVRSKSIRVLEIKSAPKTMKGGLD